MTTSPSRPRKETRLPSLFAVETQLFGWQGLTATIPANWNMSHFGGDAAQGHLRIDDEETPRLELRWEVPKISVDLELSVEKFLEAVGRESRKKKEAFDVVPDAKIVARSRKRKAELVNFGWTGERANPVGQGWGVAWQCGDCGRIVVGHVMGRGVENRDSIQRLAGEVLTSLECHGSGGWQTWSVFGLRVEIPEEFELARSKLMTGRLELEWKRARKKTAFSWTQRDETLGLVRVSLADVLLQNESLAEWAQRTLWRADRRWIFVDFQDVAGAHPTVQSEGTLRDVRLRLRTQAFDMLKRRRSPRALLRAWHCEPDNKIYALTTDLLPLNEHVAGEVRDSLECHA